MSSSFPSLLLSAERIEMLSTWRASQDNVVNLRLPVDAQGAHLAALDRLLKESPDAAKMLPLDRERVVRFVRAQFEPGTRRGLCVISCAKYALFEAFAFSAPLAAALTVSKRPELGVLSAARRDRRRFLVLLADERQARFLEFHLGESLDLAAALDDYPAGGLVALAVRAEKLRRDRHIDRLVLGASPKLSAALVPLLSPESRDGLVLDPELGPDQPAARAAERVALVEGEERRAREDVEIRRFLEELHNGAAVAGLEEAAAALQQGRARILLVRDGYAKMGRCCPACGRLSVAHRSCPWCFKPTDPVLDLVAELTDRAGAAGVEVIRVPAGARFDATGIGVCLAASAATRRTPIPTGRALRGLFALKRSSPRPGLA
jgi:hypothetical protein